MLECFKPNDIVKARVLSEQGAGREQSTSLSTTEDEMGVIYARSYESGIWMLPLNWTDLVCPKTKKKEKRKVAKPEGLDSAMAIDS